jgi:RNA polymerase sigma-70 factor (ECF subfamily)
MSDFGRMLEHEIPRLRRYARALTRDPAAADDLVQSTLVKSHLWQPGTNLRHWLFTVLHNQRVSDVRALIRERRALADERIASISPASSDPSTQIGLLELDRALAALPEARRQIVLLIGLEEMTYEEAAEILGLPVGRVRRGWRALVRPCAGPSVPKQNLRSLSRSNATRGMAHCRIAPGN